MEPIICEKTISFKGCTFKVNRNGRWSVLTFGHPIGSQTMTPKYFYIQIEKEKVPKEVIRLERK